MSLLTKEHAESSGLSAVSYAPIAKAFNKLPEDKRERLRVKFDIAYFMSTEKCLTHTIQRFVSLKHIMELKSVLLTKMRMLARTSCTILPWQNDKFYCNISPRPSSSPCYLTGQLIKAISTTKSCWLYGVILMGLTRRSTPGWIISW